MARPVSVERGEDGRQAEHERKLVDEACRDVATVHRKEPPVGFLRVAIGVEVETFRISLQDGTDVGRDGVVLGVDLLPDPDEPNVVVVRERRLRKGEEPELPSRGREDPLHRRKIVFRVRIGETERGVRVRLAEHVRNAEFVPEDPDLCHMRERVGAGGRRMGTEIARSDDRPRHQDDEQCEDEPSTSGAEQAAHEASVPRLFGRPRQAGSTSVIAGKGAFSSSRRVASPIRGNLDVRAATDVVIPRAGSTAHSGALADDDRIGRRRDPSRHVDRDSVFTR